MSSRDIRAADGGLFSKGSYIGEIRSDGSVYDKDKKYMGRLDEEGRFLTPSGIFSEREEFIIKDGRIYDNKGLYSYGKQLGSVDRDGTIRDTKNKPVATVDQPVSKPHKPSGGSGGGVPIVWPGGITCAGIVAIFLVGAFAVMSFMLIPRILSSASATYEEKRTVVIGLAASVIGVILYVVIVRRHGSQKFAENFLTCFIVDWFISGAAYFVSGWIVDGGYEGFDILFRIIWVLLMTVVQSAICAAIASLVVTIMADVDS